MDFKKAKEAAFSALSAVETVTLLDNQEKTTIKFGAKEEIWKIITEIVGKDGFGIEITLHLSLPDDFPLSAPRIYLSQKGYDYLKYLPHLDSSKLICLYDTELTRTDTNNPVGVILECVEKAKSILEQGIAGLNHQDFEDEFIAYWSCIYSPIDKPRNDVLCLINPDEDPATLNLLNIENSWSIYNYAIHNNDETANNFKEFLKMKDLKFTETPCLYCGLLEMNFTPPFDYSNARASQLLEQLSVAKKKDFKDFINAKTFPKLILASVTSKGKNVLIGWFYKPFNLNHSGFRPGYITAFSSMVSFQKNEKIIRVTPDVFTEKRFSLRSSGIVPQKKFKFSVAGLGSIGSNLVQLLNSLNFPKFRLIDKDKLNTENIGRHLLGFNYLSEFKTTAIKDLLMLKNPIQTIKTKETSIINVIEEEPTFVNDSDFVFLATGKSNIENWIGDAIDSGQITKPVFFIWVEPYLAGGHCLYIVPGSNSYKSYFSDELIFKNNVISDKYYSNPENNIALKEAGCQTSYIPYSGFNLISFLSSLLPKIAEIIEKNTKSSKTFTWIGNIEYLNQLKIALSEFAKEIKSGDLIEGSIK